MRAHAFDSAGGAARPAVAGSICVLQRLTFLYSSSVVAPMQRSSPRASIGFSRLAASIEPLDGRERKAHKMTVSVSGARVSMT
jgi:hypothetical protein